MSHVTSNPPGDTRTAFDLKSVDIGTKMRNSKINEEPGPTYTSLKSVPDNLPEVNIKAKLPVSIVDLNKPKIADFDIAGSMFAGNRNVVPKSRGSTKSN